MSDVTRRLSRWKAKYSPEIAAQTTARIYADMSERYQASMVALCTMETETKQVLDSSGIDTMYIVFYLDFARQLFRLSHGRTISGATPLQRLSLRPDDRASHQPPLIVPRRRPLQALHLHPEPHPALAPQQSPLRLPQQPLHLRPNRVPQQHSLLPLQRRLRQPLQQVNQQQPPRLRQQPSVLPLPLLSCDPLDHLSTGPLSATATCKPTPSRPSTSSGQALTLTEGSLGRARSAINSPNPQRAAWSLARYAPASAPTMGSLRLVEDSLPEHEIDNVALTRFFLTRS